MKLILGIVAGVGLLVAGLWYLSGMDAPDVAKLQVTDADWTQGKPDAKLTLIEYADFECPACGAYQPVLKQVKEAFKDDLRFVYRQFPLTMHKNALAAALAAEAAGKQGKFWEMHDLLFAKQKDWGGKSVEDASVFEGMAQELGLNLEQFKSDVKSDATRQAVERGMDSGQSLHLRGTPTFFLNGKQIDNPASVDAFKALLQSKLDGK